MNHSVRNDMPRQWLLRLADYWTLTKPEVNFLVLVYSTARGISISPRRGGLAGPLAGCSIHC